MSDDSVNLHEYNLPSFKNFKLESQYKYNDMIVDNDDLEGLNRAINNARLALFKITESINQYERKESLAKIDYERAWRRAYVRSEERTDSAKKIRADLLCEDLEDERIVNHQIKEDLIRSSHAIRIELNTLQNLSNNVRQQMKI